MLATVKYQIATYQGIITVNCEPNDDNDFIIAKAKRQLKAKAGEFPLGYQSWKVTNRE